MHVTAEGGANGRSRRYTKADWTDFVHTGPGTLAGRYLRRFWQPVARAEDLPPGRARPIRIMSEDFTLYRGEISPSPLAGEEPALSLSKGRDGGAAPPPQSSPAAGGGGKVHLLAFRCAHRGTQLSTGWVEGENLRCFYHGWVYGPDGQCLEQPAEPEPFCQRIKIKSYPTEEYLGLIFVYLGEGEPPPLPRYPDFEVDGVREVDTYVQPCNYFQTLENDPVHGAFVHRKPNLPKGVYGDFPAVSAEETEWGIAEHRRWLDGEFRTSQHGMPNIRHNMKRQRTIPPMPEVGWADSLYWRVPVDDEHVIQFTVDLVHVTGALADVYRERRAAWLTKEGTVPPGELATRVLAGELCPDDLYAYGEQTNLVNVQDFVAQVGQGAIVDRAHEHLGRIDAGLILFRKIWQRELRALAEGRPIKRWVRTPEIVARTSQYASSTFDHGRRTQAAGSDPLAATRVMGGARGPAGGRGRAAPSYRRDRE